MRQVQRLWNVSMKIRSSPRSRRVAPYALDAAKAAGVRRVVLVSSILTDGRTMGATDSPGFKITNAFGGTAACLQFCHATRTLRRPRHILDRMSASLSRYSHIASSTSYTRQNVCNSVTLLAHCVVHVMYSTECLQVCHATRTCVVYVIYSTECLQVCHAIRTCVVHVIYSDTVPIPARTKFQL